MGLRFFRRIRITPGVALNLSRSGVSTSIGTRGARVTVGHGKTRETVGLPGTGLSYTTTQQRTGATGWALRIALAAVVFRVAWIVGSILGH